MCGGNVARSPQLKARSRMINGTDSLEFNVGTFNRTEVKALGCFASDTKGWSNYRDERSLTTPYMKLTVSRNSERRKEKSRDAARCRRSREANLFDELLQELPIAKEAATQLDKASTMRLALGYLKVKHMMKAMNRKSVAVAPFASLVMKAVEGFLLILSEDGGIIFLSQNVHNYLGLSHLELIGHSIYEFSHPCDHSEIKSLLAASRSHKKEDLLESKSIFFRMKCPLATKGRNVNLKSSSYKLIHCIGNFRGYGSEKIEECTTYYLLSIGEPIPHPSAIEIPFDKQIFLTRHSPDMKFTDVDERITDFLGYNSEDLKGKSVYSFYHALDALNLERCYKILFSKGQCQTSYYRFLAKHGGYVWVLTQATLIYENSSEPACVVCLNYVLSKTENEGEIVSSEQVEIIKNKSKPPKEVPCSEKPITTAFSNTKSLFSTTREVFGSKDSGMNKNYLNFPDTDILLFQETIKDSKLALDVDLFAEDSSALDQNIEDSSFFGYRDGSLSSPSYCGTPDSSLPRSSNSTSPDHLNTMPSTPDSCTLSELSSLDGVHDFADLDLKLGIPSPIADKDTDTLVTSGGATRAPFISMNMDDDFPLIIPSSSVMWGPQEPLPRKAVSNSLPELLDQPLPSTKSKASNGPSMVLALLKSDLKKQPNVKGEKNAATHRDFIGQKKWSNPTTSADGKKINASGKLAGIFGSSQRHSISSRHSGSHVIMLDSIPNKKHHPSSKSTSTQKRSGHTSHSTGNSDHSGSPKIGSHTATMKVKDKLIQVQVSVSELPTIPIEKKQSFPSPPEPPPKRASPLQLADSPKRQKKDNGALSPGFHLSQSSQQSVLLNLLISGEDASNGYLCSNANRSSDVKSEPAVITLPSQSSSLQHSDVSQLAFLLDSDCDLIPTLYDISTYDAEVNAPIQSPHLLQGEDLLSALDQPLLRDVPTLV